MDKFLSTHNRATSEDPLKNFAFLVEIDGIARAGFSKCSIPEAKTEVVKYREGGDRSTPRKSPGQSDYDDITLERGVILAAGYGDKDFMNWYRQVFDVSANGPKAGKIIRKTADIVFLDREGNEAERHRVREAWPCSYKRGTDLDGSGNDNHLEKIVLTHEGVDLVQ